MITVRRPFFLLLAGAFILVAAACGSNSPKKPSVTNAPPTASATPDGQVVVSGTAAAAPTATVVPAAGETAVALGPNVALVPFTDPNGRFTMKVPEGWTLHTETNAMSATLPGNPASALVGVYCGLNTTVDKLIATDQSVQQQVHEGDMSLAAAHPITVAGVTGREVPWKGASNGVAHEHWFVYFQGHGCTWRVAFTTFPNVDGTAMHALLLRMLDTFTFTS